MRNFPDCEVLKKKKSAIINHICGGSERNETVHRSAFDRASKDSTFSFVGV